MRLFNCAVSMCALLALAAGCGFQEAKSVTEEAHGGMAIIDLDAVAKRLGKDLEISESVQKKQTELNEELKRYQEALTQDLTEKVSVAGETPTPEQTKEHTLLKNQMNIQLSNAQRKAQIALEVYKQSLIGRFRDDVKPLAQEVATARGFSAVVPKNDNVLTFDPAVEITNAVVERMKGHAAPAAAPKAVAAKEAKASEKTGTQ